MPNTLLSGPAGSGKSQLAKRLLLGFGGLVILVDFQSIYAALTGDERGPDGKYPLRNEALLPIAEYVRRAAITGAVARDIGVIATNSDGNLARRQLLLKQMGPLAVERVVDPGRNVVVSRLVDIETGELSEECEQAVHRWYGRLPNGN